MFDLDAIVESREHQTLTAAADDALERVLRIEKLAKEVLHTSDVMPAASPTAAPVPRPLKKAPT
jgi:hypothetical protein